MPKITWLLATVLGLGCFTQVIKEYLGKGLLESLKLKELLTIGPTSLRQS